jgi:hypothetical protein
MHFSLLTQIKRSCARSIDIQAFMLFVEFIVKSRQPSFITCHTISSSDEVPLYRKGISGNRFTGVMTIPTALEEMLRSKICLETLDVKHIKILTNKRLVAKHGQTLLVESLSARVRFRRY